MPGQDVSGQGPEQGGEDDCEAEVLAADALADGVGDGGAVPTKKNLTKLQPAAHSTAHRGRSTRVATTVAMEFAPSWKPFVSNSKARAISPPTASGVRSTGWRAQW